MKNRLAITLTLILCFASMTFAQTSSYSGQSEASRMPITTLLTDETDVIADDTPIHIEHIFYPVDLFFSLMIM